MGDVDYYIEEVVVSGLFWRFRWLIVVAVVLLLSGSGAIFVWEQYNDKKSRIAGDLMYKTLFDSAGEEEMLKGLQSAEIDKSSDYKFLVNFKLASVYAKEDSKKAREAYDAVANDKTAPREIRELAQYLRAVSLLKDGVIDLELERQITQLASGKGSVFASSAKEALALLKIQKGEVDAALGVMKEVVGDYGASPIVRRNLERLLEIYGGK